jgi:thioredoxin reductase
MQTDDLIVGAEPVGLVMAIAVARYGTTARVIDWQAVIACLDRISAERAAFVTSE